MEVKQVHQTIGVSSQVSDGVVGGLWGLFWVSIIKRHFAAKFSLLICEATPCVKMKINPI